MFLWSICFPIITIGLPYAPHITFAAMRAFLAGSCLLIPALILKRPQPRGAKIWLNIVLIGLGATTLGLFGMFHASEFVSPGIATVVSNSQPLMAAVMASVVLNEYLNIWGKAGLVLGFLGIVFIAIPGFLSGIDNGYLIGLFLIILAALGVTVSNVLIRRISPKVDALSAMGWQLIIGSMFLAIIAVNTEEISNITWNIPFLTSLFVLAIPGTAVAYWLWCEVLKNEELNRANAFSFLVPVFGLVMGAVFFNEKIGVLASLGVILILVGIVIVNASKTASSQKLTDKVKLKAVE